MATAEVPYLLAPAQAARRVGVNVRTLAKWADEGKLTGYRLPSGVRRYDVAELDALIHETGGTAHA